MCDLGLGLGIWVLGFGSGAGCGGRGDCGSRLRLGGSEAAGPVSEHHQGRHTEEGGLYLATSSPRFPVLSFFHTGWVGEWRVTKRSGSQSRHSPNASQLFIAFFSL